MSDSTNPLNQVSQSAIQREATINANFAQASGAMMFGYNSVTSSGLTWGYMGGRLNGTSLASGTVALTASNDNYIVAHKTTLAVSVSTATTNWNDTTTYARCYKVVAGASTVTSYEDHRYGSGGILGGGAASNFTGGTLTSALNYAPTVTIASSTTPAIGAAAGNYISITGTTTITGFDTIAAGASRILTFTGILTLTHNGTSLILPTVANITTAAGDVAEFVSLGTGNWRCTNYERASGQALVSAAATKVLQVACSDQTTAITTGTAKMTFRMPYAMTLTAVRASLNTVSSSGAPAIDINKTGVGSLLSTTITIDASEKTSTTAATPPVISTSALSDDDEITIDIDTAGTGAKGLIVTLIGT